MQFRTHTTGDLDEARAIIGHHFYANFVDLLSQRTGWQARFDVTPPGPVTIGDLDFGTDVRMRFGELGAYHVDVPLSGSLIWRQGGAAPRQATVAAAAVFQPVGDTVLDRWHAGCRLLAIKIDKGLLENTLAGLIDGPVRSPVRLDPVLDISAGVGAGWLRLLGLVAADAGRPDGLLRHPVIGAGLRESLVVGLLVAAGHQYRDRMERQTAPAAAPGSVRRVIDAMQGDPCRPFTVAELARIAGVGPRSLQLSFQRYVGMSPMSYLRQVRLGRAHDDLRHSDLGGATVAEIALRNGFPHFGRFAAAYRDRYGVSPRQTLRE
jgi:AraC-like DNA-binding protein